MLPRPPPEALFQTPDWQDRSKPVPLLAIRPFGEHAVPSVTVELTRSIEPISEDGMGKMMVIEGTATDGREYSAVGTYEKQRDPLLGDLWALKSIALETI